MTILFKLFFYSTKAFELRLKIFFFGLYNIIWYPKDIKILVKKTLQNNQNNQFKFKGDFLKKKFINKSINQDEINFHNQKISSENLIQIWKGRDLYSHNKETQNLFFRFHWILELLVKNNREGIKSYIDLVCKFIETENNKTIKVLNAPYNISERISNLSIFFIFLKKFNLEKSQLDHKFKKYIYSQLIFLLKKLEYLPSGRINNHILNNARALYIGATFIGNSEILEISKKIIKKHLPKMLSESGFLKENSTHYHNLVTKSICEIYLISQDIGDQEFMIWLENLLTKMLSISKKFVFSNDVKFNSQPKLGDVSPDFDLNWFDLYSNSQKNWSSLWNLENLPKLHNFDESLMDEHISILNINKWKLISCTDTNSRFLSSGHGHEDFGSFIIYFDGLEIISDIGRFSYDQISKQNKLKKIISGEEDSSHSRYIFFKEQEKDINKFISLSRDLSLKKKVKVKENLIEWTERGNTYKWKRKIELKNKEILIKDCLDATFSKGFLFFSPKINLEKKSSNIIFLKHDEMTIGEIIFQPNLEFQIDDSAYFSEFLKITKTKKVSWESSHVNKIEIKILIY